MRILIIIGWVIRGILFFIVWVIAIVLWLLWFPFYKVRAFDILFKAIAAFLMWIMNILLPSSKKRV